MSELCFTLLYLHDAIHHAAIRPASISIKRKYFGAIFCVNKLDIPSLTLRDAKIRLEIPQFFPRSIGQHALHNHNVEI